MVAEGIIIDRELITSALSIIAIIIFAAVFYKKGIKKAALVLVGLFALVFLGTIILMVLSPATPAPEETGVSYAECLELEGAEYCNDQAYNWCMDNLDDQAHCLEYKDCLDLSHNLELCDDQYFEFE